MKIEDHLLTKNQFSRPGNKIGTIKNIVVHWVGNAGSTAIANRNYFESLKDKKQTYASSHYIIGLQGEIIRCVPESEVAYHANKANSYSIGIEVCHPDWVGKFAESTYKSLIDLLVDLCTRYKLDPQKAIIRHYDVTGKDCPHYYVQNVQAWHKLKDDVSASMVHDDDLKKAAHKIAMKYNINECAWDSINHMKMMYAASLINKLGGIRHISEAVKANGMQFDDAKWTHIISTGAFSAQNMRALIIKFAATL